MDTSDGYCHIREDHGAQRPKGPEALLAAYISLRRALGFSTRKPGITLRQFLRFVRGRGVTSLDRVGRELAEAWLRSGSPRQGTVMHRLMSARGFFRYLVHLGVVKDNVWNSFPTPRREQFIPYIFSLAELRAILDHLRREKQLSCHVPASAACRAMFHTLYACGLRAGEACRLDIGDVDFQRSLLVVRKTKFGKTRLVPFNSRTRELIDEYIEKFRPRDDAMLADAPLFLSFWRRRLRPQRLGDRFKETCRAVGIYRPKRTEGHTIYGGTTVHALRHSFAVHRLLTGARASEIGAIKISDLSLWNLRVTVTGKGGKKRVCGLWETTVALMRIYLTSERRTPRKGFEDYLFISQRRRPFTRFGIYDIVRRYAHKAAKSRPSMAKKKVTPHTIRHTTALHLVESGDFLHDPQLQLLGLSGRGDPRCSFPNDLTAESLVQAVIAQRIEFTAEDFHSTSSIELATSGDKRK